MASFLVVSYGKINTEEMNMQVGSKIPIDFERKSIYKICLRKGSEFIADSIKQMWFTIDCKVAINFSLIIEVNVNDDPLDGRLILERDYHHEGDGIKQFALDFPAQFSKVMQVIMEVDEKKNPGVKAEIRLLGYDPIS